MNYILDDAGELVAEPDVRMAEAKTAVPDLLAACEGALRLFNTMDALTMGHPAVQDLRVVIAKTKGGA